MAVMLRLYLFVRVSVRSMRLITQRRRRILCIAHILGNMPNLTYYAYIRLWLQDVYVYFVCNIVF